MQETIEKEQSFLGMFYAPSWPDLKIILEEWRNWLKEPNCSNQYMDWVNLEFIFDGRVTKQKIYRDLAHIIAFGWFKEEKLTRICDYLARHTNLNENNDMQIRAKNIRHAIYGQMTFYKEQRAKTKSNGTIIITTQQGCLSEKNIYRAGSGVNSYW